MVVRRTRRTPALRRLVVVLTALVAGVLGVTLSGVMSATGQSFPAATPQAHCGPGARPETDIQGRVPQRDYDDGRVKRDYRCNTVMVAHQGTTGGFKVIRYRDAQGHVCAYYDSTLLFPKDALFNAGTGLGVVVLDMSDPSHPVKTTTLETPAMDTPHESVLLNQRRGLLGAVSGNPATEPGLLDLYDVRTDCRHPALLSSTPGAVLGHESGFAPDGRTFYASSTGGQTLVALDVSDPTNPVQLYRQAGVNYHGMRLSDDGRTLYVANIGNDQTGARFSNGGLRILDVSEIQDRKPNPQVRIIKDLSWPEHSIPQVPEPFTKNGRQYLLEVDEYANYDFSSPDQTSAPVGAARIIDVTNPAKAHVVSDLRLQVHQPSARKGPERNDPGANIPVQGYAGHYCSVPTRHDPRLVACSMILSGLRIFDISDLRHPVEAGYHNKVLASNRPDNPTAMGAFAMSQPAWDVQHRSVWYSDGNSGFYVVRLVNGIQKLLAHR
ncbi:MAG: LVIVD repeat-containing protein [Nocardioides sp.]